MNQKAFMWEGVEPQSKQLQILIVFAESKNKALDMFYAKESEKSTIRRRIQWMLDEYIQEEVDELSPAMTEVAKILLYSQSVNDGPLDKTKMYKFTPERLLYILADKQKQEKVEIDDLDLEELFGE